MLCVTHVSESLTKSLPPLAITVEEAFLALLSDSFLHSVFRFLVKSLNHYLGMVTGH